MASIVSMLIGKKLSPEEQVKKWKQSISAQSRDLDKTIRGIDNEEIKTKKLIKAAAKRQDLNSCKLLSVEIIRARKVKDRIYTSKAQLNSLLLMVQQQMATVKVTGALSKSGEIMSLVNNMVKLPEISHTMQELSKEMMKAGILGEMIQDTIELNDQDDLDEAADEAVDKVLFEMTDGILGQASAVGNNPLETSPDKEKDAGIKARLSALKS